MRQAVICGWVQAPSPTPSAPKEWKLDVHVDSLLRVKPYQCEITIDVIQEKQITESAAI